MNMHTYLHLKIVFIGKNEMTLSEQDSIMATAVVWENSLWGHRET